MAKFQGTCSVSRMPVEKQLKTSRRGEEIIRRSLQLII